jgi:hypothetical protein
MKIHILIDTTSPICIHFEHRTENNTTLQQCTHNTPFSLTTSLTLDSHASAQLQESELKQGDVLCDVIQWHTLCGTVSVVAMCSETVGLAPL